MPYIITTYLVIEPGVADEEAKVLSRIAVATLDKAREQVVAVVRQDMGRFGASAKSPLDHLADVERLPESGGTIGPLPDGTVIEVEPMSRDDVTSAAGEPRYIAGMTADEMVAAFNSSRSDAA